MTTTMMAVALKMTDAGVCAADDIDDDELSFTVPLFNFIQPILVKIPNNHLRLQTIFNYFQSSSSQYYGKYDNLWQVDCKHS